MFNTKVFGKMKDGAFFINTSRGGVVDETALLEALKTEKLSGAAVDVLTSEPMSSTSVAAIGLDVLVGEFERVLLSAEPRCPVVAQGCAQIYGERGLCQEAPTALTVDLCPPAPPTAGEGRAWPQAGSVSSGSTSTIVGSPTAGTT